MLTQTTNHTYILTVAIFFYAEAKYIGYFIESLLNGACVNVCVCVWMCSLLSLVASFAQKTMLRVIFGPMCCYKSGLLHYFMFYVYFYSLFYFLNSVIVVFLVL